VARNVSSNDDGGGIYNYYGVLNVSGSLFSSNKAQRGAGLAARYGTVTVGNSTFANNVADLGGGIDNGFSAKITVSESTFNSNVAYNGGGIYHNSSGGVLSITNSTFAANNATNRGGGIYNGWDLELSNITFKGNNADTLGGGIFNDVLGTLTIVSNTFSGNSAYYYGGAIYNWGTLNYTNTILANSLSGGDCYNSSGSGEIGINVNNLVENNAAAPNLCGTPLLTVDPNLGDLADNGGFTQTLALLPGSPAIDAGNDANCPPSDQRGISRPQGSHCDIGAYESLKSNGGDTTGVFRPSNGALYLKNKNETGFADVQINYGVGGDKPVTGDWNDDGIDTIGVLRGNVFYLRNENTIGYADIVFALGNPGDMPIAGNWDGKP